MCPKIDRIFVSSDSEEILSLAEINGCVPLLRPDYLCNADTNHGDVIIFEYNRIKNSVFIDNLTVLLGNTAQVFPEDISATLNVLEEDTDATSALTVWEAQDDHPLRAMTLDEKGYLQSYLKDQKPDTTASHTHPYSL